MPYQIRTIEIEGFRGFREKKELKFNQGLIILYGPQRSGKSSILNAPVWALIGSDASKVNMGPVQIRERAEWMTKNLYAKDCRVEIHLQRDDGDTLVIERWSGRDNYVVRHNGFEVNENPLKALRLTLDGLVSSVFLPQEVVRAALSIEPRHRRAIFSQLAGIEDLRALEMCIKDASEAMEKSVDRITRQVQEIDILIKSQIDLQKTKIRELSEEIRMLGISDHAFSNNGLQALVRQSVKSLTEFCEKYSKQAPIIPDISHSHELPGFINELRSLLAGLESKSPETEQQEELYHIRYKIKGFIAEQQDIEKRMEELNSTRQIISKEYGSEKDLKLSIEESEKALNDINDRIKRAGKYLKMIKEALSYFETLTEEIIDCPICQNPGTNLTHVLEHLISEVNNVGLEPLRQQEKAIENALNDKKKALNQLLQLSEQEKKLKAERIDLETKVSELRNKPLSPNESIELVLKSIEEDIINKIEKLNGLLEARNMAIQNVREELKKLEALANLFQEKLYLDRLDDIPNLPEYRALIEIQSKAELHKGLLSEMECALRKEIEQAFQEKFASLKERVNEFYNRLVGREDFSEIWIDVSNWEVRAGVGGKTPGVTQVFNVGDITAVAISIFLASATKANHDAGFILLDDPIQSLDEAHETRLAEILAELAENRQVVVSCSRTSFLKALETVGTVNRQIIRLAPWNNFSCRFEGDISEGL